MKISADCEIERIVSEDPARENLSTGAYYDAEKKRLAATNGHMLACVQVTPDDGDTSGYVTEPALKAARKIAKKLKSDAQILVNGTQRTLVADFPRPTHFSGGGDLAPKLSFPPVDSILSDAALDPADPKTVIVGLDAGYLLELAKAIGAGRDNDKRLLVELRFKRPTTGSPCLTAIHVSTKNSDAFGVLMPARVVT